MNEQLLQEILQELKKQNKKHWSRWVFSPLSFFLKRLYLTISVGLIVSFYCWSAGYEIPFWKTTHEVKSWNKNVLTYMEYDMEKEAALVDGTWYSLPSFDKVSSNYLDKVLADLKENKTTFSKQKGVSW